MDRRPLGFRLPYAHACASQVLSSRDVLIIQDDMWEVATLRPTKNIELAKTGDATKRQVVTELTLCAKNEAANGGVFDNTTS
jgi:hypothetical protein